MSKKKRGCFFFIDELPTPTIVYAASTGQLICWNKPAQKLLGYASNERLNISQWRSLEKKATKQQKTSRAVDLGVIPHITKKGEELLARVVEKNIVYEGENCKVNWITDITEHVRTELAYGNFYQAVTSASIVSMADKHGTITYVNDNFVKISGYAKKKLVGENHRIINSAHHPKSFWIDMWKTIAAGKTWRADVKNKAKDGSYYWVDTFIMPFLDSNGKVKEFLSIRNDITKKKEQEEKITSLNHSLADFQNAITKSSIVSRADKKGLITYVNKNFVDISGYNADELVGRNHNIINSGYHAKAFWTNMWKTIASGENWRGEVKNRAKDGSYYWVDTFIMPFLDSDGKVREFLSIRNDITSRKEARESLIKINESLSDTLIFGKMGSAELDLKTFELAVSKELLQMLEVPSDKPARMPVNKFLKTYVDPVYLEMIQKKIEEGIKGSGSGRSVVDVEFEMITAKGKRINIEAKGIFKGETGLGILHDISERKEKESEIKIKDEREKLILSSTLDAIVGINKKGEIIIWNSQAEKIFGWEHRVVLGKMMSELIIPEKYREEHSRGMQRFIKTGNATILNKRIELEAIKKNGTIFPIELTIVSIGEGSNQFFCSFIRDISERKEAEQRIINEREHLNSIINSLPGIFYLFDENGKFLKWNKNFERVSQYSAEEIEKKTPIDFVRNEEKELISRTVERIFSGGSADVEANFLTKDNRVIPYYFNGFQTSFEGKPCLVGMGIDLSDLRRVEGEKLKAEVMREELLHEVFKKNQQIENILFSVTDYLFSIDRSFNFILVNPSFAEYSGFRVEDMVGKNAFELLPHLKDSPLIQRYRVAMESQKYDSFEYESIVNRGQFFRVNAYPNPEGLFVYFQDVSGEKVADLAIRKSQIELHAILNASRDSTYYLDRGGFIQVFNRTAAENILKLSGKTLQIGMNILEVTHPDAVQDFKDRFQKSLNGEFVEAEREIAFGNVSLWIHAKYMPIKDELGKVIGVSLTIEDITARKESEIALRESEERFKLLYNNTPVMLHSIDVNTLLIRVSDYWLQKMEYKREEVIGKSIVSFMTPVSQEKAKSKLLEFQKSGRVHSLEIEFVTKSGKILNTIVSATAEYSVDGDFISSMTVITDITEKKKIEMENERLALIASHTSNSVFITDAESRIEWINRGFENIIGYSLQEIKGKRPFEFLLGENTNRETFEELQQAIKRGEPAKTEILGYRKSGEECWLSVEAIPIKDTNGSLTGFIGVQSDITSLKMAITEMLNSQERLETMMSNAPMLAFIKDLNGRYIYTNEAFMKSRKFLDVNPQGIDYLSDKNSAGVIIGTDQQVIKSGWPVSFEHAIGEKQYYTVKFPIREFGGKISSIGGISIDITDRKKLEVEVKQSELRLLTILNTEPECVSILNEKAEFLEINKAGLNMIEADDLESLKGIRMSQLVQEPFRDDFIDLIREVFQGGEGMFEFKISTLKGKERWVETQAVPMRNADGGIASFLGVTRDITQRKEADRKLQESEQRYRKLFELNPVPTWIYDTSTLKFLDVNNAAIRHYGYTEEEFKKMTIEEIRPETEKQRLRDAIERQKKKIHGESPNTTRLWKHVKKDGSEVDVEVQTTPLDMNDPVSRLVTVNDVTEKLKTQNKLLDLVKEKEMLIREIHHRVKNNLQLISSILYIQLNRMTPGEMKDFLNEMRQRIKSIAFLHERLLQSGSINQLEMSQYLQKLIADINASSGKTGQSIKITAQIEQVWMDTDVAIYCGLIMNELITNSIKYAFVGRTEGNIMISLKRIDSKFEFYVADDGVGMPLETATDVNSKSSFGMQLLDTFGKQINATVSINNSGGTKFKYTFS